MKLTNPLYYPLAVLGGAIVLVVGVRLLSLPRVVMLPVAVGVATIGASLLQTRKPEAFGLDNAELERELQQVKQQAESLAERANAFRVEATHLLDNTAQLELLGTVQYACDRATELPAKVSHLARRMQGADSLLSVTELQQQLNLAQARLQTSSGAAREQLNHLTASLQRNIQLARQGQDARQAQVLSLSTLIQEAAGMLQQLQNKLRTADLSSSSEALELQALSNEFKSVQDNVDLLVSSDR